MNKHFIPRADIDFDRWVRYFILHLSANAERFGVPAEEVEALQMLFDDWENWYGKTKNPSARTSPVIVSKNDSRKILEAKARFITRAYLRFNPLVTDGDRENTGLPVYKTTHTAAPVPIEFPLIYVRSKGPGVIVIYFRDSVTKKRAKPFGIHGAEMVWEVLDHYTIDWKELKHSVYSTKTPITLYFDGKERGKTIYLSMRWVNTRGKTGPWSQIHQTIIP